jgi:exopolysaccharide production protein ExoY
VLSQDVALEPIKTSSSESQGNPDLASRLWQHHAPHLPHRLSPAEADATLTHASAPGRHLRVASAVPLIRHGAPRRERHQTVRPPGEIAKRLVDVIGALILALLLSPVLLVVGMALARDRGPVIYRHARTGRHGRAFRCLKFRTMVPNAEQVLTDLLVEDLELQLEWARDQKLRNDPRVTAIGRFLRRTSLDELPQLWNVLKGDMSLVGPRPVVREELLRYGRRLDDYLAAKPGITGLWQVMGRNDTNYRRRVALDTYYARKRNLLLDVFILIRTVKVVLCGRGAY